MSYWRRRWRRGVDASWVAGPVALAGRSWGRRWLCESPGRGPAAPHSAGSGTVHTAPGGMPWTTRPLPCMFTTYSIHLDDSHKLWLIVLSTSTYLASYTQVLPVEPLVLQSARLYERYTAPHEREPGLVERGWWGGGRGRGHVPRRVRHSLVDTAHPARAVLLRQGLQH